MKHVKIFDGEDSIQLTREDIEAIGIGSPRELIEFYQATYVFRDVIKSELAEKLSTSQFEHLSGLRDEIEEGYLALCDEIITRFGEDTGLMIMANTINAINLEKNERLS
jgi:hypothetical protein